MFASLRSHWLEYLIEAALLALFMLSASSFGVLLEHPGSPLHRGVGDPLLRRALMGCAMGLTAMALIYSPLGKRSGAHMNPSVTLTFWRLGKVRTVDALFYIAAQVLGALAGMAVASLLLGRALSEPTVNFVATVPGSSGLLVAFVAEFAISFLLMGVVLSVSNVPRLARFTGLCAGTLVALYITLEAPLSGMSMNPARSFGSAWLANLWPGFWIYVTAPVLGMLVASLVYCRVRRPAPLACAKLHHSNPYRCIFCRANT